MFLEGKQVFGQLSANLYRKPEDRSLLMKSSLMVQLSKGEAPSLYVLYSQSDRYT